MRLMKNYPLIEAVYATSTNVSNCKRTAYVVTNVVHTGTDIRLNELINIMPKLKSYQMVERICGRMGANYTTQSDGTNNGYIYQQLSVADKKISDYENKFPGEYDVIWL